MSGVKQVLSQDDQLLRKLSPTLGGSTAQPILSFSWLDTGPLWPRTSPCYHFNFYCTCTCLPLVSPPMLYWKGIRCLPPTPPSYPISLLALRMLSVRTSSCHQLARAGEPVLGYLGNAALPTATGPTWLRLLVVPDLPWWPLLFFTTHYLFFSVHYQWSGQTVCQM